MGKVTVVGGKVGMEVPLTGILASDIAVGSTVKLLENGNPAEYLVVNKGIPSNSSLYDASCDGVWLLRKSIHSKRVWHSSGGIGFENSEIASYLNGDFLSMLGEVEQKAIKQVKIPYSTYATTNTNNITVVSGTNGLSTKIFLLSCHEVGLGTVSSSGIPADGAKLDYFVSGDTSSAQSVRIGYLDGTALSWWLRSRYHRNNGYAWAVHRLGTYESPYSWNEGGVRPAFILPHAAVFDEETMLLKGVA